LTAVTDPAREGFLGAIRDLADHPGTRGRDLLELPYVTRACRLTAG
jgi:hypothetical protein